MISPCHSRSYVKIFRIVRKMSSRDDSPRCSLAILFIIIISASTMIITIIVYYFQMQNNWFDDWISTTIQLKHNEIDNNNIAKNINLNNFNIPISNSNNNLFKFTCKSFEQLCGILQLNPINTIHDFNTKCKFIIDYLFTKMFTISPLFILSFRREYFIMFIQHNNIHQNTLQKCHNILIHDIFKVLHTHSNFHQVKYPILFHTHISKCSGTTFADGLRTIATLSKIYNNTEANTLIRQDLYPNTQTFIFKGIQSSQTKPYSSCKWLYNYHTHNISYIPLKIESESPLVRLCPQYYNSILLRDPIQHRLSFLSYLNHFMKGMAGIYCKHINQNVTVTEWKLCSNVYEMKGFMFELFNSINDSSNYTLHKQSKYLLFEYINKLIQNRSIGYGIVRKIYKEKQFYRFDRRQLIGWMSNLYNRWIGYNYSNYLNDNQNVLNSINANYYNIIDKDKNILFNSKRVLLQYDYVLPIDHKEFSTNSNIWVENTKHILKHMFNITNGQNKYIHVWPHSRKQVHAIRTERLFDYFNKTGELDLLIEYNRLDIQLYKFSKMIARADLYFLQQI
eukprot:180234_1